MPYSSFATKKDIQQLIFEKLREFKRMIPKK